MSKLIIEELDALAAVVDKVKNDQALTGALDRICERVRAALAAGNKVLTMGNGGSATDAQHLAEELIGRYRTNRVPLPALSLSADASALTCIGNDFGYDAVFSRQVEALAQPGDVVVGFTTSGNSPNILNAFEAARKNGALTIGMLGKDGGKAKAVCDEAFVVPHNNTARIQELHTLALHLICETIERQYEK